MAGFSNGDRAFFLINSPDVNINSPAIDHRIISLSVVEEMSKLTSGSLRLHDPDHALAKTLRFGVKVDVSWGYLFEDANERALLAEQINPDEFTGNIARRGFRGFIVSPSGGGSQAGQITYNANFQAFGWRGERSSRTFEGMLKREVVATLLDELGVLQREIDFQRGNESLAGGMGVRQDETAFAFLTRLSFEWRAHFTIGYLPSGDTAGLFVDIGKLGKTDFQRLVLGARGRSNIFDYGGSIGNVISWTWRNEQGLSGKGDSAQLVVIDGQPTIVRYVVEDERVVSYKLDVGKVERALLAAGEAGGPAAQYAWMQNALAVTDFEQIREYFVPDEQSTAPQGKGYTLQISTKGNPLYTAGNTATFGTGFPGWFTSPEEAARDSINWYIRKVTHTINREGYLCDIEVADAFAFSDIGAVFQTVGGAT